LAVATIEVTPLSRSIRFVPVKDADPSRAIVEQVRTKLQKGLLKQGDRLPPERDFAEQLGVSRNTVRKAVNGLVQLGLVTVRKGASGGAFIAEQGGNAIRVAMTDMFHLGSVRSMELTEARLVLSQAVVRLACERCSEDDIAALEANVSAAEKAIVEGDVAGRIALNIEFYRLLALAARNEVLTVLMDAIGQAIMQFVRSAGLLAPGAIMPVRRKIIACLLARDADAAVAALTEHLTQLEAHYRQGLGAAGGATTKQASSGR
jgi:GntR family transcriptional repressor for pyruvate dehydrogenase complex